jgi:hypothetical protein
MLKTMAELEAILDTNTTAELCTVLNSLRKGHEPFSTDLLLSCVLLTRGQGEPTTDHAKRQTTPQPRFAAID